MRKDILSSCVLLLATACATDDAETRASVRRSSQVESGTQNMTDAEVGSKGRGGYWASSSGAGSAAASGGSSAGAQGGAALSGSDEACLSRLDKANCACLPSESGQRRDCFSGSPGDLLRGTGCKLGTQICSQVGGIEFKGYAWSACTDQVTVCGGNDAGRGGTSDAAREGGGATTDLGRDGGGATTDLGRDGGGATTDLGRGGSGATTDLGRGATTDLGRGGTIDLTGNSCGCPGTVRWCDLPPFCRWGSQTCLPDGAWGPCLEASAGPKGCLQGIFDTLCCQTQKLCCAWNNHKLIGDCPADGCPSESAHP